MKPGDVVTVPASLRRLGMVLVISNLGIDFGLFRILGPTPQTVFWCLLIAVLSVLSLLPQSIRQTQRLEITSSGFTNFNTFGKKAQEHTWPEIDGHFGVIRIGSSEAVAYRLTEEYKTRVGKQPTRLLSGYDEAIPGVFTLSAPQVALLLNNHKAGIAREVQA